MLKEDDSFTFLLFCPCCHQSLISSDQRPLHSCYIYFVHQWNPVKAFYGFDSYSLPPRQRERERKNTSFTFIHEGAAARRWQQERCFSLFLSSSLGLSREYHYHCVGPLQLQPFFFFFFTFQFILRFEKTATKWDISFLFYHFDLIILFLLFQDLDLFHVFSLGRYREDRKAITGANNKSETCGLFQNVLVLLGVLQSPGLVKNEECVKEWGCELTDAETGSENCRKERTRGEH